RRSRHVLGKCRNRRLGRIKIDLVVQLRQRAPESIAFADDRDQCALASVDDRGPNSTRYKSRQSSWYSVKTTRSMMRRRTAETRCSPPEWFSNSRKRFGSCSPPLELKFKSSKLMLLALSFAGNTRVFRRLCYRSAPVVRN